MSRDVVEVINTEVVLDGEATTIVIEVPGAVEVVGDDTTQLVTTAEPQLALVDEGGQSMLLVETGQQGPPGRPGEVGAAYVEFVAGVALGGHRAARLLNGEAVYADHTSVADANVVLGITRGAAATGAVAQIQFAGLMNEPSWNWTPDQPVFVGLAGVLTQTPPASGFSLIVGVATASNQIFIGAKAPIVLQE